MFNPEMGLGIALDSKKKVQRIPILIMMGLLMVQMIKMVTSSGS
jgi:hypothetical protein